MISHNAPSQNLLVSPTAIANQHKVSGSRPHSLNHLSKPIFVIDAKAGITFSNRSAVTSMKEYSWGYITGKTLHFVATELDTAFRYFLEKFITGTLTSDSISATYREIEVTIRPFYLTVEEINTRSPHPPFFSVSVTRTVKTDRQGYLQEEFCLTPAEAAIGAALLDGKCSSEIAAGRRVSVHTLRKQVNTVLAKTDCRTQHQFVAKALTALHSI